MRQRGAALIAHYLDPDRLPAGKRWSRKHAHTQERLCQRFAAPVIATVTCHPLGLVFPSPRGRHWRGSNFERRVLAPAYRAAGWRDADGNGTWTWHSLRHVFCTTALFTWKLRSSTDVSRMAGHANYRITLDIYVGTTAGVLDRARAATE